MLASGCAGAGQPGVTSTAIPNASKAIANASNGQFISEFSQGYGHHANASALFYNATSSWDNSDYAAASSLMSDARNEYALAGEHYHNMGLCAGSPAEQEFASALEESTIDMDEASSRYMLSIAEAVAGNKTTSLMYFKEGQELADQGMVALNQSQALMPPYLSEAI